MNQPLKLVCLATLAVAWVVACGLNALAAEKSVTHYVITNDDLPGQVANTATFFSIGKAGKLTEETAVRAGADGIAGGYFGMNKISVLNAKQQCVYVTASFSGQIATIALPTFKMSGVFNGSSNDTGQAFGVGLANNAKYLYASFTDSNAIGTFKVLSGCKLKFLGDTPVIGLQAGAIDGMAIHGDMLVATYGDGSIESFNISAGMPVSNGDKQNSTGYKGANYPGGIDITQDGHYAIFGDVSTSTVVEVSDISSGKLSKTTAYHLGSHRNSSTVRLSPDETLLYVANTQSGQITAAFFDKTTGTLSKGCTSKVLKGFASDWPYLGAMVTQKNTGTGSAVYVAEYGAPSFVGMVNVKVNAGKCRLTESPNSPVSDSNSIGLLSIAAFPPRSF